MPGLGPIAYGSIELSQPIKVLEIRVLVVVEAAFESFADGREAEIASQETGDQDLIGGVQSSWSTPAQCEGLSAQTGGWKQVFIIGLEVKTLPNGVPRVDSAALK